MAKVLGVGGVFFKSADPEGLDAWYAEYLGIVKDDGHGVSFSNAAQHPAGFVVWSPFAESTKYFDPSDRQYMFNLVVDDLQDGRKIFNLADCDLVDYLDKDDFIARISAGKKIAPDIQAVYTKAHVPIRPSGTDVS